MRVTITAVISDSSLMRLLRLQAALRSLLLGSLPVPNAAPRQLQ
jgi:hypothetical protein